MKTGSVKNLDKKIAITGIYPAKMQVSRKEIEQYLPLIALACQAECPGEHSLYEEKVERYS